MPPAMTLPDPTTCRPPAPGRAAAEPRSAIPADARAKRAPMSGDASGSPPLRPEHPRSALRAGPRPAGDRAEDGAADRAAARRRPSARRGSSTCCSTCRRAASRGSCMGSISRGAAGRAGDARRHGGRASPGAFGPGKRPLPGAGRGRDRRHHAGLLRHARRPRREDAAARRAPLHLRAASSSGTATARWCIPSRIVDEAGLARAARGRAGLRRHRGADLAGDLASSRTRRSTACRCCPNGRMRPGWRKNGLPRLRRRAAGRAPARRTPPPARRGRRAAPRRPPRAAGSPMTSSWPRSSRSPWSAPAARRAPRPAECRRRPARGAGSRPPCPSR